MRHRLLDPNLRVTQRQTEVIQMDRLIQAVLHIQLQPALHHLQQYIGL